MKILYFRKLQAVYKTELVIQLIKLFVDMCDGPMIRPPARQYPAWSQGALSGIDLIIGAFI